MKPRLVRRNYLLPSWKVPERIMILRYLFDRADTFIGYFPEGKIEGSSFGLAIGRDDFSELRGAQITSWNGMKNSITILNTLSDDAKSLIIQYENGDSGEAGEGLWTYELLSRGEVILYVHDFSVAIISANEEELAEFQMIGIDIAEWEKIEDTAAHEGELAEDDMEFFEGFVESVKSYLKSRFGWVEKQIKH